MEETALTKSEERNLLVICMICPYGTAFLDRLVLTCSCIGARVFPTRGGQGGDRVGHGVEVEGAEGGGKWQTNRSY